MRFVRHKFRPGLNQYSVTKLIGDASMRQYFRYTSAKRESFILAVYPEPFDPKDFNYLQIYELLRKISIPVPEIFEIDGALGIVLQEDLGNITFQKWLMTATTRKKQETFCKAIDFIATIQNDGSPLVAPSDQAANLAFDFKKLLWEFDFFRKQYLKNYRHMNEGSLPNLENEFQRIAEELSACPRFLCHRDFHVRNLMIHRDSLYLIDFQDARWGPPSYDLVSLLKDSYDLNPEEVEGYLDYFLSKRHLNSSKKQFLREFHLMAVQRLSKALGTFGYQVFVRNNFIYEQYMVGSLRRLLISLEYLDDFPKIRKLTEAELAQLSDS